MAQLQIAYFPRRGTQERGLRLCQEVAELHADQFVAACQQAGISQVQVRLLQLLHSELLLVTLQMQEPQQTHEALASSQAPFAHWLREQLQGLLGWDVQEVLADPPADLLLTWKVKAMTSGQRRKKPLVTSHNLQEWPWRMTPVQK
jgi:hypothetical protein